jgi:hypothetical protein
MTVEWYTEQHSKSFHCHLKIPNMRIIHHPEQTGSLDPHTLCNIWRTTDQAYIKFYVFKILGHW